MLKTVRFWVWHLEGWVKLTLKPDQELSLSWGGPDEEGYSYTSEKYIHEGEQVLYECVIEAQDCDGRLTNFYSSEWDGESVRDEGEDPDVNRIPKWVKASSRQRDYVAEAMGY